MEAIRLLIVPGERVAAGCPLGQRAFARLIPACPQVDQASTLRGVCRPLAQRPTRSASRARVPPGCHNADTGLVYLRARWYQPGEGTLLGRDPFVGYPQQPYSLHPYQYGFGQPTRYTDPSGRDPWWTDAHDSANAATCGHPRAVPTLYQTIDCIDNVGALDCHYRDYLHTISGQPFDCPAWDSLIDTADIGSYFIPYVGAARMLGEAVVGKTLRGNTLVWWERCLFAAGPALSIGSRFSNTVRPSRISTTGLRGEAEDMTAYWLYENGTIIERPSASKFPSYKQPNGDTCGPTCVQMAEAGLKGSTGDYTAIFKEITAREGVEFAEIASLARQRGLSAEVVTKLNTAQSLERMQVELAQGHAVIAGVNLVGSGGSLTHAVLIRSVETQGRTWFDWRITFNDPLTGNVWGFDGIDWSKIGGGYGTSGFVVIK